ncbi:MAG: NAD(+) synthase [Bacilli bacterium]|nr:NAD(+) synthase [Bacilli bacterium]
MSESEKVIHWIKNYFEENGKGCKAVIGISGGTDSSIVAALLVKALGKENVIGVMMPNGYQHDQNMAKDLIEFLGIPSYEVNIEKPVKALAELVGNAVGYDPNTKDIYATNTPARVRMTVLYGICALVGGRVANTCNLSEDHVGYSTKFGDAAGDFSPISSLTKTEVKALGYELGLPKKFIEKIPEDGMSGKSDEEKLGFTYAELDHYILTGEIENQEHKAKIDRLNRCNLHKLLPMPRYEKKRD